MESFRKKDRERIIAGNAAIGGIGQSSKIVKDLQRDFYNFFSKFHRILYKNW